MATTTSYTAPDLTSFATFANFFKPLSQLLASNTSTWTQQNDTGQAVWVVTSLTISAVAVSGSNAVYTYDGSVTFSPSANPAPRIGMSVTIAGFANAVNNVTATITALGGGGASSTFTVTKVTQTNETHAATGVTTLSTLPGSNASIYEIWGPNDSLQTGSTAFYVKLEYFNNSGTGLKVRITAGTATNGAGTLSGNVTAVQTAGAVTNSTTGVESNFSVGASYFGMFLARTNSSGGTMEFIAIDRTRNTDGTISSDGVTIFAGTGGSNPTQQTLLFATNNVTSNYAKMFILSSGQTVASSDPLNNQTPVFPVYPVYGKVGNPTVTCVSINGGDFADGCLFTTTLYGQTMTFLVTKNFAVQNPLPVALRYD